MKVRDDVSGYEFDDGRGPSCATITAFLRDWLNERQPISVYERALDVLDRQASYVPEKVIHEIVRVTVMSWLESAEAQEKTATNGGSGAVAGGRSSSASKSISRDSASACNDDQA